MKLFKQTYEKLNQLAMLDNSVVEYILSMISCKNKRLLIECKVIDPVLLNIKLCKIGPNHSELASGIRAIKLGHLECLSLWNNRIALIKSIIIADRPDLLSKFDYQDKGFLDVFLKYKANKCIDDFMNKGIINEIDIFQLINYGHVEHIEKYGTTPEALGCMALILGAYQHKRFRSRRYDKKQRKLIEAILPKLIHHSLIKAVKILISSYSLIGPKHKVIQYMKLIGKFSRSSLHRAIEYDRAFIIRYTYENHHILPSVNKYFYTSTNCFKYLAEIDAFSDNFKEVCAKEYYEELYVLRQERAIKKSQSNIPEVWDLSILFKKQ